MVSGGGHACPQPQQDHSVEGSAMARDSDIPTSDQGATSGLRGKVRHELDKLRELAQRVSIDEVRQGEWFAGLLEYSLGQ